MGEGSNTVDRIRANGNSAKKACTVRGEVLMLSMHVLTSQSEKIAQSGVQRVLAASPKCCRDAIGNYGKISNDRLTATVTNPITSGDTTITTHDDTFLNRRGAGFFYLTASFSAFPARNAGTRAAEMVMTSPVCGLRPVRSARDLTSKVPKPVSFTSSPAASACVTASVMASTTAMALASG